MAPRKGAALERGRALRGAQRRSLSVGRQLDSGFVCVQNECGWVFSAETKITRTKRRRGILGQPPLAYVTMPWRLETDRGEVDQSVMPSRTCPPLRQSKAWICCSREPTRRVP